VVALFAASKQEPYQQSRRTGGSNLLISNHMAEMIYLTTVESAVIQVIDITSSSAEQAKSSASLVKVMIEHLGQNRRWDVLKRCGQAASRENGAALLIVGQGLFHELSELTRNTVTDEAALHDGTDMLAEILDRVRGMDMFEDYSELPCSVQDQMAYHGILLLLRSSLCVGATWLKAQAEWDFLITSSVHCATDAQLCASSTALHCEALDLIGATLVGLETQEIFEPALRSEYEDRLTGAAYTQLVDVEATWPNSVWLSLSAILPLWVAPERTLMVEYADELALRLTHPLLDVRATVYQLMMRLVGTALSAAGAGDGSDDEDDDEVEDDGVLAGWDDQEDSSRPQLLPGALWDIVEGDAPSRSKLRSTPGYFFAWGIILQTIAHGGAKMKAAFTDHIRSVRIADALLPTLASVLPVADMAQGSSPLKPSLQLAPLSVLRTGGSVAQCAAALYGRALAQLPAISRSWFNT
jgi:hypothetical protein